MLWIVVHNVFVMQQGVAKMVDSVLVQNFSQPEVGRYRDWVELNAVLEVLFSLLHLASVCQLCGQMDTSPKMRLIEQQALFETRNGLLKLLSAFVEAPKIKLPQGLKFTIV